MMIVIISIIIIIIMIVIMIMIMIIVIFRTFLESRFYRHYQGCRGEGGP